MPQQYTVASIASAAVVSDAEAWFGVRKKKLLVTGSGRICFVFDLVRPLQSLSKLSFSSTPREDVFPMLPIKAPTEAIELPPFLGTPANPQTLLICLVRQRHSAQRHTIITFRHVPGIFCTLSPWTIPTVLTSMATNPNGVICRATTSPLQSRSRELLVCTCACMYIDVCVSRLTLGYMCV